MKPFARISLSFAALRRGILVSSLVLAARNGRVVAMYTNDTMRGAQ